MADLLIKGMKMPQNCDECSLAKMESEFHGICTAIHNDVCYVYPDKGKPDWCPLAELEPVYKKDGRRYVFAMWAEVPKHYPIEASEEGEQDGKL